MNTRCAIITPDPTVCRNTSAHQHYQIPTHRHTGTPAHQRANTPARLRTQSRCKNDSQHAKFARLEGREPIPRTIIPFMCTVYHSFRKMSRVNAEKFEIFLSLFDFSPKNFRIPTEPTTRPNPAKSGFFARCGEAINGSPWAAAGVPQHPAGAEPPQPRDASEPSLPGKFSGRSRWIHILWL